MWVESIGVLVFGKVLGGEERGDGSSRGLVLCRAGCSRVSGRGDGLSAGSVDGLSVGGVDIDEPSGDMALGEAREEGWAM